MTNEDLVKEVTTENGWLTYPGTYHLLTQRMTNRENQAWAGAGYPGMKSGDAVAVAKLLPGLVKRLVESDELPLPPPESVPSGDTIMVEGKLLTAAEVC